MKMLWDACYFARRQFLTGRIAQGLSDWRDFLYAVSLFPVFYYQLDGRYLFKKDAIDKFIKDYNYGDLFGGIIQARACWNSKNFATRYKKTLTKSINPFIWPLIFRKMATWKNEYKNNYGRLFKQYFKLTEKATEDLFNYYASWRKNFFF